MNGRLCFYDRPEWQGVCTSTNTLTRFMDSLIYITRKKDLFDVSSTREITLQEWTAFVANDPEMRLDNHTTVILPNGEEYRYSSPGTAVLLSRETGQSTIREVVFDFTAGNILIKNADQRIVNKVRHIAYKLNAQVFQETKSYTVQIPVDQWSIQPRFRFIDAFMPFKRAILHVSHLLQHAAFSLFRNSSPAGDTAENVKGVVQNIK
jgi:hypothetical protein